MFDTYNESIIKLYSFYIELYLFILMILDCSNHDNLIKEFSIYQIIIHGKRDQFHTAVNLLGFTQHL